MQLKTLIIYDNEGYIIQQITGSYRVPIGVPYLEVDESSYAGKIIKGVNVQTKKLVLEDIPKTELQLAQKRIETLEKDKTELQTQVVQTQVAMAELLETVATIQGTTNA